MIILSGAIARVGSIVLLAVAVALAACSPQKPIVNDVARDDDERQNLIEAMKHHPALKGNEAATGKPIDVPKTVPPKPPGTDDAHDHIAPKPQR